MEPENSKKPLFKDLTAEDDDLEVTEIESLCVNCGENGITRLLLTKIPYYKDVVVMSFDCEHCHFQNNELQSGGKIQEKGVRFTLRVKDFEDLNRQVVKSDYTSVSIPEIEFEIPAQSQKGEITTVEGIIQRAVQGLEQDQGLRKTQHPEVAQQIDEFIQKLESLRTLSTTFTLVLQDISGNSFIQNPNAPKKDTNCEISYFIRKKEEDHTLGIYPELSESEPGILTGAENITYEDLLSEILAFQTNCPSCNAPCETNMKVTNIPYFKEVVIMATNCDTCGARTNEVKSGGGIEDKGLRIEIKVSGKEDYSRDILKSETCSISVPELELEVGPTTFGGKFTTVEGLLTAMKDQLSEHSAIMSDTRNPRDSEQFAEFIQKLNKTINESLPITIILDDPAGNSYVQSLSAPDPDEKMKVTRYDRTFDQNEDLGLNDIKVENYEEDS